MGTDFGTEALETGVLLQSYEIQAILGKGGFGITYLALDRNLKQQVALKEFFPHEVAQRLPDLRVVPRSQAMAATFDWGKSRFLLEAQILAQFRHPNIVRVLTLFEAHNTAYMAMDLERGRNLAEILDQSNVLEEGALQAITLPLLSGLEALHQQGFLHRDIKPENIVIRDDGSPVLIDFGSARNAMGRRSRALTTLLTPGYSPLEQYYSTNDDQGPWTDIYALAGVLYRCLSGNTPPESALRTSSALSGNNDPLVPAVVAGLGRYSRRFLEAVDKGLRVLEKDRPQSVAEWRALLFPDGTPIPEPKPLPGLPPPLPLDRRPAVTTRSEGEPRLLYVDEDLQRRMRENALDQERPGHFRQVLVLAAEKEQARADCALLAAAGLGGFRALARGRQGLLFMEQHPVDLVLCDVALRDMAGLSFLHHAGRQQPLVPVVLLAHAAERGFVLEAVALGVAGFMKRPVTEQAMQRLLLQLWQVQQFYGQEQRRLAKARRMLAEARLQEALESAKAVAEIVEEPQDYYDSGFRALLDNQFGRAMVAFKRGAKILLLAAQGRQVQGEVLRALGREREAKGCDLRAARSLARLERLEETRQLFVNIVRNKSHIPNPFNTLGVALRRQEDYAGALGAYDKALELTPDDPHVHYNRARALVSNLEHDAALAETGTALTLKPSLRPAQQLYKMITGAGWPGAEEGPELEPGISLTRRGAEAEALLDD